MPWRSDPLGLRLLFGRFWSFFFRRRGVRLVTLKPVPWDALDREVQALVLREINEQVYAEERHHPIRLLVAYLWLALGVCGGATLLLFGTADAILLATVAAGVCAVVAVRRREKPVVVTTAVVAGAVVVLVAGPYHEHIHLMPLLLGIGCVARGGWLRLAYRRDLFVVTGQRVLRLWGVLFKNRAVVPLGRILDITVHKPLIGRWLGYGHLVFESAAQEQGLRDVRFMTDADWLDRTIQVLQYGGAPDDSPQTETPAEAESDLPDADPGVPDADPGIPDADAGQPQPYPWGGSAT